MPHEQSRRMRPCGFRAADPHDSMCTSAMPPPSHIYASTSRRRSGRRWRRRRTFRPALLGGLTLTALGLLTALALLLG